MFSPLWIFISDLFPWVNSLKQAMKDTHFLRVLEIYCQTVLYKVWVKFRTKYTHPRSTQGWLFPQQNWMLSFFFVFANDKQVKN